MRYTSAGFIEAEYANHTSSILPPTSYLKHKKAIETYDKIILEDASRLQVFERSAKGVKRVQDPVQGP